MITAVPVIKSGQREKKKLALEESNPSVYAKARKRCDEIGISFNSCINQFLESWVEEEK